MLTAIPQFHEQRLTLTDIATNFCDLIGGYDIVDIRQTIRVMLADYFYGDHIFVFGQELHTQEDRTLVFPKGKGCTLVGIELSNAIDLLGDIFWALNDTITSCVLRVTEDYTHRPHECFYKFFPDALELVVYTPIFDGVVYPLGLVAIDGRAVITACHDTLPSYFPKNEVNVPPQSF